MYDNTLIFAILICDPEKCSIVFDVLGVTGLQSHARIVLSNDWAKCYGPSSDAFYGLRPFCFVV
jgi:hypothetical protein